MLDLREIITQSSDARFERNSNTKSIDARFERKGNTKR